ncbi:hypothetical protein BDW62DRAFT_175892 [Aspergillus aurantiobrunneus]
MPPAAEFIVLSSSPEHNAICTPPLLVEGTEKTSLHDASSSPLPSPYELFEPPTRSRYFATPDHNRSKTKDRTAEDINKAKQTSTDTKSVPLGDEQPRRAKNLKTGPQTELRDLDQDVLENKENTQTKPKRTRKKKSDSAAGGEKLKNKTITGKIAKSGTAKAKGPSGKPVDGDLISKASWEQSAGKEDKDDREKDLQLEPAMKRRLDWTPTKQPAKPVIELEDKDGLEGGQNGLGTLLSGYQYGGIVTAPDKLQALADNAPTKRRRIELVDARVLPAKPKPLVEDSAQNGGDAQLPITSKPKKPKTQTKRLTTLTARVTASYHEPSTNCSDYTDQGISVDTESSTSKKSRNRKTKRKADESSGFKVPRTILLSPEAAVKSLDQQDLVFGTCSQLEREDSPTLLRDTQVVLRDSGESSYASSSGLNQYPGSTRPSSAISRLAAPRNLWSVAARDTDGLLVDVEVVDLVDSPKVPKVASSSMENNKDKHNQQKDSGETNSLSYVPPTKNLALGGAPINKELPTQSPQIVELVRNKLNASSNPMPNYNGLTDISLAKEIQSYGLKAMKNRKKMIEVLEKCWIAKHGPVAESEETQSKETTTTTTAALEPQNAQNKPKKPKTTSFGKSKAQLQSQKSTSHPKKDIDQTTNMTNGSEQKLKHEQEGQSNYPTRTECSGQPASKRSFIDVEEIQDSEDELIPSPNRLCSEIFSSLPHKEESKTQKLPTSTVPSSPGSPSSQQTKEIQTPIQAVSAHSKTPATQFPSLGEQITKAVRVQSRQSQSPAGTRKRLSWHEKILMYDPIHLEDFTAWLNTEGLGLVNEDREVGAGFVRQWCESKGICCCYKVKKAVGHF